MKRYPQAVLFTSSETCSTCSLSECGAGFEVVHIERLDDGYGKRCADKDAFQEISSVWRNLLKKLVICWSHWISPGR